MTDNANRKQRLKYININTIFNHSTGKRQCHTKSQRTYIQYRDIYTYCITLGLDNNKILCMLLTFLLQVKPTIPIPTPHPPPPAKKKGQLKRHVFTTSTTPYQQLLKQASNTICCWQFSPLSVTRLLIQSPFYNNLSGRCISICLLNGEFFFTHLSHNTRTKGATIFEHYYISCIHTLRQLGSHFPFTPTMKDTHHVLPLKCSFKPLPYIISMSFNLIYQFTIPTAYFQVWFWQHIKTNTQIWCQMKMF